MKNILTVDVEDISHSRYADVLSRRAAIDKSFLERSLNYLLDFFDSASARATFFILGAVADQAPGLVRLIGTRGHEISSHGYFHRPVYGLNPRGFRDDITRSIKVLEDTSGMPVLGYRAPYWSITDDSPWALDIVKECGLKYDSSISPVVNFLYGIKGSPRVPYWHRKGLWEVPPTTAELFGKLIIIGGGFYLRALPYWLTRNHMFSLNKKNVLAMVYLHPHEIMNRLITGKLTFRENFILNFNKASFSPKIVKLCRDFEFGALKDALDLGAKDSHVV